jgi:hypothetical protein
MPRRRQPHQPITINLHKFMIPKHTQFITALNEKKKICVRFYSKPDSGVLDRVCAPLDYGPGGKIQDGLNRYWLWDYLGDSGSHCLGLVPEQIVDLQVLGEEFDPATIGAELPPRSVPPAGGLQSATVGLPAGDA